MRFQGLNGERGCEESGREYEVSVSVSKKISRINRRGFILYG
jgi:hypothetical protein